MKELLKSKIMMGFIIMVLGITYFNSTPSPKLDDVESKDQLIALNLE